MLDASCVCIRNTKAFSERGGRRAEKITQRKCRLWNLEIFSKVLSKKIVHCHIFYRLAYHKKRHFSGDRTRRDKP